MSRSSAIRDAWRPQTRQDQRYPALLKYIVEKTLEGESDMLKERTLGVEVFDRSPSYDTNADTVVRYTAGEVRKRLSLYYHESGRKPVIQICLPAGSYVPEFLHSQDEGDDSAAVHVARPDLLQDGVSATPELYSFSPWSAENPGLRTNGEIAFLPGAVLRHSRPLNRRRWWIAMAVMLVVSALAGWSWRYHAVRPRSALDHFWTPVLRDQSVVVLCTGGSVFSQTHLSGVATAGKETDYPFVSMQIRGDHSLDGTA